MCQFNSKLPPAFRKPLNKPGSRASNISRTSSQKSLNRSASQLSQITSRNLTPQARRLPQIRNTRLLESTPTFKSKRPLAEKHAEDKLESSRGLHRTPLDKLKQQVQKRRHATSVNNLFRKKDARISGVLVDFLTCQYTSTGLVLEAVKGMSKF